jgi:hypothetical protein
MPTLSKESLIAATSTPSGNYTVARPLGRCAVTGQPIQAGEKFHAALRETPTGLERLDVLPHEWDGFAAKNELLAHWLATMPASEQKKKLFVDDEVLLTLFERLQDTEEPAKLRFRFVLGLILMRKRLIVYESQHDSGGQNLWSVRIRGREGTLDLVNPHLSEDQVGDVAGQLSEILSSDL